MCKSAAQNDWCVCVYTTAIAWVLLHRFCLSLQDHKKNTLTPVWNERKWLMVQEPQTQDLRIEVFDWDRINAKELLTINLLKGLKDTMGSKTLMGRSALNPALAHLLVSPLTVGLLTSRPAFNAALRHFMLLPLTVVLRNCSLVAPRAHWGLHSSLTDIYCKNALP